jgi:acetyltransferase-like isoleucine patch superfamily enzyme
MKKIILAIVFISPPFLKKVLLRWFCQAQFGHKSRIGWFSSIAACRISIGDHSSIKPLSIIQCEGDVVIGDYSEISSFAIIYGCASFKIGNKCYIGPQTWINVSEDIVMGNGVGIGPRSTIFTHGSFLPYTEGYPVRFGKVILGNDVWIPAGVFIQPGIEIGDNVLVNSRSVITKSLPSGQYVAGFPAKPICPLEQIRKPHAPADKDKFILDIVKHFISFLQRTRRGIEVIPQGDELYFLRSLGHDYLIVLVDSEGIPSIELEKYLHKRAILLVNCPNWKPPDSLQAKVFIFDFTAMKTIYSKDKVHHEFYKFLKMYYGIIFEYEQS